MKTLLLITVCLLQYTFTFAQSNNVISNGNFEGNSDTSIVPEIFKDSYIAFCRVVGFFPKGLETSQPVPTTDNSFVEHMWYFNATKSGYLKGILHYDENGLNNTNNEESHYCAKLRIRDGMVYPNEIATDYDKEPESVSLYQKTPFELKKYKITFSAKRLNPITEVETVTKSEENYSTKVYPIFYFQREINGKVVDSKVNTEVYLNIDYEWHNYETYIDLTEITDRVGNEGAFGMGINTQRDPNRTDYRTAFGCVLLDNIGVEEIQGSGIEEMNIKNNVSVIIRNNELIVKHDGNDIKSISVFDTIGKFLVKKRVNKYADTTIIPIQGKVKGEILFINMEMESGIKSLKIVI